MQQVSSALKWMESGGGRSGEKNSPGQQRTGKAGAGTACMDHCARNIEARPRLTAHSKHTDPITIPGPGLAPATIPKQGTDHALRSRVVALKQTLG